MENSNIKNKPQRNWKKIIFVNSLLIFLGIGIFLFWEFGLFDSKTDNSPKIIQKDQTTTKPTPTTPKPTKPTPTTPKPTKPTPTTPKPTKPTPKPTQTPKLTSTDTGKKRLIQIEKELEDIKRKNKNAEKIKSLGKLLLLVRKELLYTGKKWSVIFDGFTLEQRKLFNSAACEAKNKKYFGPWKGCK